MALAPSTTTGTATRMALAIVLSKGVIKASS